MGEDVLLRLTWVSFVCPYFSRLCKYVFVIPFAYNVSLNIRDSVGDCERTKESADDDKKGIVKLESSDSSNHFPIWHFIE